MRGWSAPRADRLQPGHQWPRRARRARLAARRARPGTPRLQCRDAILARRGSLARRGLLVSVEAWPGAKTWPCSASLVSVEAWPGVVSWLGARLPGVSAFSKARSSAGTDGANRSGSPRFARIATTARSASATRASSQFPAGTGARIAASSAAKPEAAIGTWRETDIKALRSLHDTNDVKWRGLLRLVQLSSRAPQNARTAPKAQLCAFNLCKF